MIKRLENAINYWRTGVSGTTFYMKSWLSKDKAAGYSVKEISWLEWWLAWWLTPRREEVNDKAVGMTCKTAEIGGVTYYRYWLYRTLGE